MRIEMCACNVVDGYKLFGWVHEYVIGVSVTAHNSARVYRLRSWTLSFRKAQPPR